MEGKGECLLSTLLKLEFQSLLIGFGKSLISFVAIFAVSAYLLLNYWELWPVFLILLLWIGAIETPIKILKLPYNESIKIWGNTKEFGTTRVLLRFLNSLIHCVFIIILINLSLKFYIILKPEIGTALVNQFTPLEKNLILIFSFVAVLFFTTMALAVSVYGDLKKLKPIWKSLFLGIVFFVLENILLTSFNLYIVLLFHIIAIAVCLILAIRWVQRITYDSDYI